MKEAGANRGVAGAGVLAGFEKLKALYIEFRTAQQLENLTEIDCMKWKKINEVEKLLQAVLSTKQC